MRKVMKEKNPWKEETKKMAELAKEEEKKKKKKSHNWTVKGGNFLSVEGSASI